jgi:hypothetical protein
MAKPEVSWSNLNPKVINLNPLICTEISEGFIFMLLAKCRNIYCKYYFVITLFSDIFKVNTLD